MARYLFGGDLAAWAFTANGDDLAELIGGATVNLYNAETGGSQYTDLEDTSGGAIDHVTTEDGTGTRALGVIPPFYGPDGVWSMWASADGGPRSLIISTDVADVLGPAVVALQSDLTAHIAGSNPHSTELGDLVDVSAASPTNGQVLAYNSTSGDWEATTVAGASGGVTTNTDQTITGTKTFTPDSVNDTGIIMQCNASQVGDIFACFHSSGQRTGYFNEKGELRCIAAAANSVAVRFKGVTGQTADIMQITDISNNPIAWFDASGRMRAPNSGILHTFSKAGNLSTGTGTFRIYNDTGVSLTIRSVRASVGTAPATQSVIVDINLNGTTIFSTQANRPAVAAGANTSGSVTNMNTTTWSNGQYMTVDIDQIGSGTVGADLVVQVLAY